MLVPVHQGAVEIQPEILRIRDRDCRSKRRENGMSPVLRPRPLVVAVRDSSGHGVSLKEGWTNILLCSSLECATGPPGMMAPSHIINGRGRKGKEENARHLATSYTARGLAKMGLISRPTAVPATAARRLRDRQPTAPGNLSRRADDRFRGRQRTRNQRRAARLAGRNVSKVQQRVEVCRFPCPNCGR